jgi:hypothetical protein
MQRLPDGSRDATVLYRFFQTGSEKVCNLSRQPFLTSTFAQETRRVGSTIYFWLEQPSCQKNPRMGKMLGTVGI